MSTSIAQQSAEARRTGAELFARYWPLDTEQCFCQFTPADVASVGGKDGWIGIFVRFYEMFASDPVLSCLLDYDDPDVPRDPAVHGRRFGTWLLARHGGDATYMKERAGTSSATSAEPTREASAALKGLGMSSRGLSPSRSGTRGWATSTRRAWTAACRMCSAPNC